MILSSAYFVDFIWFGRVLRCATTAGDDVGHPVYRPTSAVEVVMTEQRELYSVAL
jgi:hypothetical protein